MSPGAQIFSAALLVGLCPIHAEVFTTNAVCLKNRCINPVFPGLEDLHRLEEAAWLSSTRKKVSESISFCRNAVTYDPAMPASQDLIEFSAIVRKQDAAALTMFTYHLAGLGLEVWNYPKPELADNCVKSIWRMVCFTYFPRAPLGAQDGMPVQYLRPCQSSCQNYIKMCGVECCDESVRCVFSHTKAITPTVKLLQTGYAPHDGPSSLCTGAAHRSRAPGLATWALLLLQGFFWFLDGPLRAARSAVGRQGGSRAAWLVLTVCIFSVLLQGCNVDVPTHAVGNWRAEPDYLITYEFIPPGQSPRSALLNSCSVPTLSQTVQCGGRGVCRVWDEENFENTLSFCFCDRDYADPECNTKRKSQVVAFCLSVFFGWLGADQFYLGFPISGTMKLCSGGGFGLWWIIDFIRIGSSPVETANFKLAADFPHWAFVLSTVTLAAFIGFSIANVLLVQHVKTRQRNALMMQSNEEHRLRASGGRSEKLSGGDHAAVEKFVSAQRSSSGVPDYGSMGGSMGMGACGGGMKLAPAAAKGLSWRHDNV